MILMPILYVSDVAASAAFYERLGYAVESRSRTAQWAELRAGDGALLGLHLADRAQLGTVELSMVAGDRAELDRLARELPLARGISDESFGRSLVLRDPDGLELQVNEHDRELYA